MPSPVVATLATMAVRRSRIFWTKQNQNSSAPFLGLADFPHSIYSSRALSLSLRVPSLCRALLVLSLSSDRSSRGTNAHASASAPRARIQRRGGGARRRVGAFWRISVLRLRLRERERREDSSLECPPRIKAWSRCRVLHVICAYVWLASTQRSRFFCP